MNEQLLGSSHVSPAKDHARFLGQTISAKQKTRNAKQKGSLRYQSYQGDKYATTDSTRGRVDVGSLCADQRRLFILCWAARTSDVLITGDYLIIEGASGT
jgi:hypothetical protein